SPDIEQVVLTALAKDPKDRFGSVRAFANAFSQACGEAGNTYMIAAQPIPPLAPAHGPEPSQPSQEVISNSSAPTRLIAPPAGQADPAGASISSAATRLSPQITPPLTPSSVPSGLVGPEGASLFTAETRLIPSVPTTSTNPEGKIINDATGATALS